MVMLHDSLDCVALWCSFSAQLVQAMGHTDSTRSRA